MSIATARFSVILWGFAQAMKVSARRHPAFRERLRERNLVAQIKARDEEVGRWFDIRAGKVRSGAGLHAKPDITLAFKNAAIGASLLTPPINWLDQINAQKDFNLDRRRARGSHQLVGADHDGDDDRRLEIRHQARRRHHALLQHDQWRPGVRARQGRQDRAHDADRFRRHRPAALDHPRRVA